METTVALINNLALLVALSVAAGLVGRGIINPRFVPLYQGTFMGAVAVAGMLTPLVVGPGIQFDGRTVAISLCGLYFGPVAAGVAGIMAVTCRYVQGGAGAPTGILVITFAAFAGALLYRRRKRQSEALSFLQLWAFGIFIHIGMLLLLFTLPGNAAWMVLPKIYPSVLLAFPLATVLIGQLLESQTQHLRFVERLGESEARFRATLYSMGDGVITTDAHGQILEMNPVAENLTGWPETEARGKSLELVFRTISEESRTPVEIPALRALREGKSVGVTSDAVLIARDGTECPVSDNGTLIRGSDGAIRGVVLVFRDQTAERAAEQALRAGEHRFRTVFDQQFQFMTILSPEGRILEINDLPLQAAAMTREEIVGKYFWDGPWWRDLPEMRASWPDRLQRAEASESPLFTQDEFQVASGEVRQAEAAVNVVRDENGVLLYYMIQANDITEGLRAREDLLSAKNLLERTLDSLVDAVFSLDGESQYIVQCNRAVEHLFGYTTAEVTGQQVRLLHVSDESHQAFVSASEAVLATGASYHGELPMRRKGGEVIDTEVTVTVIDKNVGWKGGIVTVVRDVTARNRIESSLVQSQRRFHQLANAIPLIVWTAEPGGLVDFANRALADYTGAQPGVSAASHWVEAVHPDDMQRCVEVWTEASQSGVAYSNEFRLRRHDGEYRWHLVQGRPVADESGQIVTWYGTAADVHDSKLNEERLRTLAARLKTTLESITDAFFTLDREWRFTYLNQEAERLLRRTKEELLGQLLGDTFPTIPDSEVERNYVRAMEENGSVEFETFFEPLDSWFEVHAYPSEEGLAVYFRDITKRILAEQELRSLSARLQGILDFSPLLITDCDPQGRYLVANRAVCELLGMEPAQIVGKTISDLLPPENAAIFERRIQEIQRDPVPMVVEDVTEIDGVEHIFSTVLFPLFDGSGDVTSIAGIAQEVTDRRHAEEEREKLETQLRQAQKMDAIGRLAGGVAHDFNNMLGVILGYTDMALESLPPDDPLAADLREVHVAATHSSDLTRQLLAFARKQTIAPEVLDLNDTVASILKMLRRLIGEDIELIWKPAPSLGLVRVDPTQIDQMLANLIVNSRDAISGVGEVIIETGEAEFDDAFCEQNPGYLPGNFVLLAVSDDGCGMSKETQAQIFEPFFTTKPLGIGTGLGLATVYGIVKQNEGFINCYSESGSGTTFRIYLPRHIAAPRDTSEFQRKFAARKGTETILLVEDEIALLTLGERLLQRLGYQVLTANSPRQALAAVDEFPEVIHLVISDVIMPEMNGRDLWQKLSARRPGMKSLFMSGYTADVIAHHGALEDGVHFLQKPFTLDALAGKIREALEN